MIFVENHAAGVALYATSERAIEVDNAKLER